MSSQSMPTPSPTKRQFFRCIILAASTPNTNGKEYLYPVHPLIDRKKVGSIRTSTARTWLMPTKVFIGMGNKIFDQQQAVYKCFVALKDGGWKKFLGGRKDEIVVGAKGGKSKSPRWLI